MEQVAKETKIRFIHFRRNRFSLDAFYIHQTASSIGGLTAAYIRRDDGTLKIAFVRCNTKPENRRDPKRKAFVYSISQGERREGGKDLRQGDHYSKAFGRNFACFRLKADSDIWTIHASNTNKTDTDLIIELIQSSKELSRALKPEIV